MNLCCAYPRCRDYYCGATLLLMNERRGAGGEASSSSESGLGSRAGLADTETDDRPAGVARPYDAAEG